MLGREVCGTRAGGGKSSWIELEIGADLDHIDAEALLFSARQFFRFLFPSKEAEFPPRGSMRSRVSRVGLDRKLIRLDATEYELLRQEILRRDGWRRHFVKLCRISRFIISSSAARPAPMSTQI